MEYRLDWRVWFRANKKESALRLYNRLIKGMEGEHICRVLVPYHGQRGIWECLFSSGNWENTFSEAIVRCLRTAEKVANPGEWRYSRVGNSIDDDLFTGYFSTRTPDHRGTWLTGLEWADFTLMPAESAVLERKLEVEDNHGITDQYDVWIEADHWGKGQLYPHLPTADWSWDDACSDVSVTFANGVKWIATFVTYQHVASLRQQLSKTGECLAGRYLQIADMVLVEDVSRVTVEEVIRHMLQTREFQRSFRLEFTG